MDEKKEVQKTERKPQPKFWHALIVLLFTVGIIAFTLIVAEADGIHVALFLATCFAVIVAFAIGFKWSDLEQLMIESIRKSVQSIMILLVIGMLIGSVVSEMGFAPIPKSTNKMSEEEQLEMIFMPFGKLNDLSEGLGLGLPLAKRHAQGLGGDLTLDTTYQEGCRFILELPNL